MKATRRLPQQQPLLLGQGWPPGCSLGTVLSYRISIFLPLPFFVRISGLSGNTWFVLLRLHAQRLGFQTSSSYSSSAPLCSSLSVSVVVTARCYVQSFCPPLHLPSSRASILSSLCITATPRLRAGRAFSRQ